MHKLFTNEGEKVATGEKSRRHSMHEQCTLHSRCVERSSMNPVHRLDQCVLSVSSRALSSNRIGGACPAIVINFEQLGHFSLFTRFQRV